MPKRKIIKIDEEKCNGCGLCVPNCREGALKIIGGKARLISDVFCDGLGACLGHCPEGAITIEAREAEDFDAKKVAANIASAHSLGGCPGSRVIDMGRRGASPAGSAPSEKSQSELRQWPVQMMLVPASAPYFRGADLLIAADCVPFACPDFHSSLLSGRTLLVGCPKLDDTGLYAEKIAEIVRSNDIRSITYAHMEVPCCYGLVEPIRQAIESSGKNIPFKDVTVSITGELAE